MLGMILGILKIVGIALLVILGILLVAVLAILFVPVRYRAEGRFQGRLTGSAQVSWLLHAVSLQVVYRENLEIVFRICGMRADRLLRGSGKQDGDGGTEASREDQKTEGVEPEAAQGERKPGGVEPKAPRENQEPAGTKWENEPETSEKAGKPELPEQAGEPKPHRQPPPSPAAVKEPKTQKSQSFWRRFSLKALWKKIRVTFRRICGKLKALAEKRDRMAAFFQDQDNRQTLSLLKRQIGRLLKHVLPGKVRGRVRFGFEDPYVTGQVLTWISPFYGWYGRSVQVIPVFDERALEGELALKGRIRAASLLLIGFRLWRDKNFRRLLKRWRAA